MVIVVLDVIFIVIGFVVVLIVGFIVVAKAFQADIGFLDGPADDSDVVVALLRSIPDISMLLER
jgi:uncharacterized protein YneF (UPF0154 family)